VRDERRVAAVRRLMASEDAVAEADAAYEAALCQRPRDHRAAQAAADDACRRTAGYLLRSRHGQLTVLHMRAAVGRSHRGCPAVCAGLEYLFSIPFAQLGTRTEPSICGEGRAGTRSVWLSWAARRPGSGSEMLTKIIFMNSAVAGAGWHRSCPVGYVVRR
jgi:hypothetical protein